MVDISRPVGSAGTWFIGISAGLVGYVLFLNEVAGAIGWPNAIRGVYPAVGVLLTIATYSSINGTWTSELKTDRLNTGHLEKLAFSFALLYLPLLVMFDVRWKGLIVLLPLLAYCLVRSLLGNETTRSLRLIVLVFLLPPVTKISENGYYFGNGDILKDIPEALALLNDGSLSSLPGSYPHFPFTYVLTATSSMVSSVDIYTTYHVVGIVLFSLLPLVVYNTIHAVSNKRTAAIGAFTTVLVYPFLYWSTYFIPPSHAFVFFSFLIYILFRVDRGNVRWVGLSIALVAATVFTHHLSILFMLSVLALVLVVQLGLQWSVGVRRLQTPIIFVNLGLLAIAYWLYRGKWFIRELVFSGTDLWQSLFSLGRTGRFDPTTVYISGVPVFDPVPAKPFVDGILWMITPDGIINTLYIVVLLLSLVYLLYSSDIEHSLLVLVVPGLLGIFLLLKTPFVFPTIFRLRLYWALPAVFVLTFGIKYMISGSEAEGVSPVSVFLLLLLATTAPLSVADDVDQFRPDADKQVQKSFSSEELAQIDAAAEFGTSRMNEKVTTTHLMGIYMREWYPTLEATSVLRADERCRRGTYVYYRDSWADHVTTTQFREEVFGASRQHITTGARLNRMSTRSDQIFTTGAVGLVRSRCVNGE